MALILICLGVSLSVDKKMLGPGFVYLLPEVRGSHEIGLAVQGIAAAELKEIFCGILLLSNTENASGDRTFLVYGLDEEDMIL